MAGLTSALATRRARRLSDLVVVFTFATAVTARTTIVGLVQRPLEAPQASAALVMAALVVVEVGLW